MKLFYHFVYGFGGGVGFAVGTVVTLGLWKMLS